MGSCISYFTYEFANVGGKAATRGGVLATMTALLIGTLLNGGTLADVRVHRNVRRHGCSGLEPPGSASSNTEVTNAVFESE